MQIDFYSFIAVGLVYFAVGYTLLRYSKDGDLHLQKTKNETLYLTPTSAWERLSDLVRANATEVNWNTTLFVAISSTLVLMGVYKKFANDAVTCWALSVFVIYAFQDIVIRWKQAHRKHATSREQMKLIENLRWGNDIWRTPKI